MSLNLTENYNASVIHLKGKLVGGPLSAEFSETLHSLMEKGKKNVIVDMSHVGFISSSGLGILISGLTSLKKGGGDLKLAAISHKMEGLLSITKLDQIFEQYETVEQAEASFNKPAG
jgi:anti-sigma B factor antagonist